MHFEDPAFLVAHTKYLDTPYPRNDLEQYFINQTGAVVVDICPMPSFTLPTIATCSLRIMGSFQAFSILFMRSISRSPWDFVPPWRLIMFCYEASIGQCDNAIEAIKKLEYGQKCQQPLQKKTPPTQAISAIVFSTYRKPHGLVPTPVLAGVLVDGVALQTHITKSRPSICCVCR